MIAVAKAPKASKNPLKKYPRAYGGHHTVIVVDGDRCVWEGVAIPTKDHRPMAEGGVPVVPLYCAKCEVCRNASAQLMLAVPRTVECESCRGDRIAIHAITLQSDWGIELCWKRPAWWVKCGPTNIEVTELRKLSPDKFNHIQLMRLDEFGAQFDLGWDELGRLVSGLDHGLWTIHKGRTCVFRKKYSDAVSAMIALGARLR